MVRLTDLLWAAKKVPSYMKVNKHFRFTMSRPGTLQSQLSNIPGVKRPPVQVEPIMNWKYYKGDLVCGNLSLECCIYSNMKNVIFPKQT